VRCFLTTGVDHLALHDVLVSKNAMRKNVAPVVRSFGDVDTILRGARQAGEAKR
jgi:carbamoyltransferase